MKKAVRKGASKAVALVLSLAMIFGMAPMVSASAGNTADAQDNFDRIVHLDMGRKYFTPDWIKSLIDEMAKLGYNQLELDFGNSQTGQFRFALDNMDVNYTYTEQTMVPVDNTDAQEEPAAPVETEEPVEEQPAAPVQTEEPVDEEQTAETVMPLQEEPAAPAETVAPTAPVTDEVLEQAEESETAGGVIEYTYINEEKLGTINLGAALPEDKDGKKQYITEAEMVGIIEHAESKGIEIVPLLNSPGHFGAVLCAAPDFRYPGSSNSLDITNEAARNFGVAVVQKYAAWFVDQGCTTFNIGADEFANDSGMGFANLQQGEWANFDSYITALYDMLKEEGYTTVRMFNDGVNYGPDYGYKHTSSIPKDIEICYWSCGWDGYDVASAGELASAGYSLINTNGDYYFVLKNQQDGSKLQVQTEEAALGFSNDGFMGSTVSNSTGSMFCIWCDEPNNATQDEIMAAVKAPMTAVAYRMQGGEAGTHLTYEEFKKGAVDSVNVNGVVVAASGVTSMTVQSANVPALSGQSYVAYDMKPAKSDGSLYTDEAQVTIPLGELAGYDASKLTGFVVEENGTVTLIPGTKSGSNYIFTMPHFSVGGVAVLETKDILLKVGETPSEKVPGDVRQDSYNIDTGIAKVDVQYYKEASGTSYEFEPVSSISRNGQYIIKSNGQYLKLDGNSLVTTTNVQEATLWKAGSNSGGKLSYNSYYLQYSSRNGLTTTTNSRYATSWEFNGSKGLYYEDGGLWWTTDYYITYSGGWTTAENGSNQVGTLKTVTTEDRDESVITFTGVSAGQTSVTIGGVTYSITVIENLDVEPLNIQYWITNGRPTADGSNSYNVDAAYVNSEAGMDVTALLPEHTIKETRTLQYWRCRLLDTTKRNNSTSGREEQTEEAGDDETYNGTGFTKVRYWDGQWSVYTENNEWVAVESKHQLVAYYLEILPVADELTVTAADWGKKGDGSTSGDYLEPSAVCTVSVQVIYEDGTTNPKSTSADDLKSRTIAYGYWTSGRGIGTLNLQGLEGYQIWKVEAETGSERGTGDTWGSYTVNNFTWDNNAVTVYEGEPVDSYIIHNDANNPNRTGYYKNLMWDENYEAILIKVYVKAAPTEDSLTVHYMNRTAGDTEFYKYNINVYEGTTFDKNFALDPDYTDIDQALSNNSVKNNLGVTQDVTANLGKLTEIGTQYRYSEYRCVEVARSENGKDVYLYYTFNNTHNFVVDFGLPVTITTGDLNISGNWTSASIDNRPAYGTAEATTAGVTYTPNEIVSNVVTLNYTLTGESGRATHFINLIPASTMYYEAEDFVASWKTDGQTDSRTQAADKLGDEKANNYGSDPSYNTNVLGSSNGAALVTDVKPSGSGKDTTWPSASFTFTGTGADIISQTDSTSTLLLVEVKNADGLFECAYLVNNNYKAEASDVKTIYQVPVIKIDELKYGTYTVTIKPFYDTNDKQLLAVNGQENSKFYLDAIRVYNPLDNGDIYYTQDGEANAQFINLSKCGLKSAGLWVDSNPNADVVTYENIGPNNEIYLAAGQSVTITLKDTDVSGKSAQIGARLISGTSGCQISVNDKQISVNSTVDQYYTVGSVSGTITITNNGSGIVALTTLKLTGSN